MRLHSHTAPDQTVGSGSFLWLLTLVLMACGCAGEPPVDPESEVVTEDGEAAEQTEAQVDAVEEDAPEQAEAKAPLEEVHFEEDPFASAEVEVVGGAAVSEGKRLDSLWEGKEPESQLVDLGAAPPVAAYDEDFVQQTAELGLARLQARLVADELSREARVRVPDGPHTFGQMVPITFETRNPFGDPVELLPPQTGMLLELDWTVTRWLPIGASDRVQRHRYFRLDQWFLLEADQVFREYTELPLQLEGDTGSVWLIEVDARLRCAGAVYGEKELPVHTLDFRAARFLVLPPGWEELNQGPLESLARVIGMASPEVDRHVLVCAALLKGADRQRGVELLLQGLHDAPNDRRRLTLTQALQWLTGLQLGSLPETWMEWGADRNRSKALQTEP